MTSLKHETRGGILDQTAHTTSGLILFKGPRISGRASYAPPAKCAMISAGPEHFSISGNPFRTARMQKWHFYMSIVSVVSCQVIAFSCWRVQLFATKKFDLQVFCIQNTGLVFSIQLIIPPSLSLLIDFVELHIISPGCTNFHTKTKNINIQSTTSKPPF
jgi:hypothetical protein